jgi:nucleoid-associated protein YgaU
MTFDAKVGLVLGLIFVIVIVFIINGPPHFRNDTPGEERTTIVNSDNDSYIGSNERKAQETIRQDKLAQARKGNAEETQVGMRDEGKFKLIDPIPDTNNETKVDEPTGAKPDLPKIYVIQDGDNLAKIAQKFYGETSGNKTINVTQIFEANREVLKSPDDIHVGQKLVIPQLKNESKSVFSGSLFQRIKSTIGTKPSSINAPTVLLTKLPAARPSKQYVVCEGDNLWRIANKQLGDGERFREIIKLNDLEDEDCLTVGMRLKIPIR